jgi:transposase
MLPVASNHIAARSRGKEAHMHIISLDTHKHYSLARVETSSGELVVEQRIEHRKGAIKRFIKRFDPGSPVAIETSGNYYWIVAEIEEAGMVPKLVNARKAKARIAETNSSDRITVRGLNMLQHTNRLPTVWIPPHKLRDVRELTRTRMYFSQILTGLKCRTHSEFAKYGISVEASDFFGPRIRETLLDVMATLPEHTLFATREQLDFVDHISEEVAHFQARIMDTFQGCRETTLLKSLPGVGPILSVVIYLEVGDVSRFRKAGALATYSGTTPRLSQSGNRRYLGAVRRDVNQYLKWAFVEAANVVCMNRKRWQDKYAVDQYEHVRSRRNHGKAIVAVARHLAESTWWMLKKKELYCERGRIRNSSREA